IIVTDQISPTLQPAFPTWSKVGSNAVVSTKPFLGGESINTYVGWQQTSASNTAYKTATWNNTGSPSLMMEGTINLVQAFGSMPSNIWVCAAAYATTNGGALVAQGPAAVTVNGNIESNEFLMLSIPAITDSDGDGVYDRLDPTKGFLIQSVQPSGAGGYVITWASVPGKTYQVMYSDSPGAGWTNAPLAQVTASAGQLSMSYTDASATNGIQRFYKIHCSY
ncbi:MAG TPA: hypothetical protein VLY45_00385, partial [Nitrospiria bacterium]|nr:hypothetical protein [Nitrospiria bacterium]